MLTLDGSVGARIPGLLLASFKVGQALSQRMVCHRRKGTADSLRIRISANGSPQGSYYLRMTDISSIAVFCASSPGTNDAITAGTITLGELLAAEGIELVYGGGAVGLMGLVADTVMKNGGRVTGVLPGGLFPDGVGHDGITELISVANMHERKQVMYDRADAFIALPGGFGTLEEIAEVMTWRQIGLHNEPFGFLNIDGFWDHLLSWFDRCVDDVVLKEKNRELVITATTPEEMLERLRTHDVTVETKWTELD